MSKGARNGARTTPHPSGVRRPLGSVRAPTSVDAPISLPLFPVCPATHWNRELERLGAEGLCLGPTFYAFRDRPVRPSLLTAVGGFGGNKGLNPFPGGLLNGRWVVATAG